MADGKQVQAWLEGLQQQRQAKIGETSGVGDLLTLLGGAAVPKTTAASMIAAHLDEGTGADRSKFAQGVVSPKVKAARNATISQLAPSTKPRIDMIPDELVNYERYKRRLPEHRETVPGLRSPFFYNDDKHKSKFKELLVNKEPKAGLTINKTSDFGKNVLEVDAAPRKDKPDRSPEAIKAVSRALAAFYPQHSAIGGVRESGIRYKLSSPNKNTTVPLPKLSDARAQQARSNVSKWLDERISERAPNTFANKPKAPKIPFEELKRILGLL